MTYLESAVNLTIKTLTGIMCKIETEEITKVPKQGPLIIVTNHINFIEVPLVYVYLQPRPLTGYVKEETWDNPVFGLLFDLWEAIPVRRGEADIGAIKEGVRALENGQILAVAPEGTRSKHGRLQKGYPGVTMVALMSGAPILPLVYYGNEHFWRNVKRLKRTDFNIKVGHCFYLDSRGQKVDKKIRQQMTTEIMYQIAGLLPSENRGIYADLTNATTEYLNFNCV